MEEFWLVWNPEGGTPKQRHDSEESAKVEARRLSEQQPGQEFFVLQAVGVARPVRSEYVPLTERLPF